jgi:hypothetical protein
MDAFVPFINLFGLLTAFSIAAERLANVWKLRSPALRDRTATKAAEKDRESRITRRTLLVGIGLAIVLKANLFEIINNLNAPWDTIGWYRMEGSVGMWVPDSFESVVYAVVGSAITGVALGFGSKFWHEILDIVLQLRERATPPEQRTTIR